MTRQSETYQSIGQTVDALRSRVVGPKLAITLIPSIEKRDLPADPASPFITQPSRPALSAPRYAPGIALSAPGGSDGFL